MKSKSRFKELAPYGMLLVAVVIIWLIFKWELKRRQDNYLLWQRQHGLMPPSEVDSPMTEN